MYNAKAISDFYDKYGMREWERLNLTAYDRINFYLHMHFLQDFIGEGKNVLDAGCGAGRFSIEIAKSGSNVTLLDISKEQLKIAKIKLEENNLLSKTDGFINGDLRDLSMLEDNIFDTVVCYGAPLNYLMENREKAVEELIRVTKPGGTVLISVNSKWGVIRSQLGREDFDYTSFFGKPDYWYINEVVDSGDLPQHEMVSHPPRHFFETEELENLLIKSGLNNVILGGSPCITSAFRKAAEAIEKNETAWRTILDLEEKAYCKRTMADNGEFLLARGTKLNRGLKG
ncbi:methyltransferase domain-containing protein [Clostridium sp. YIM B02515]|uniref:Methyltransferase domain-containing protein n=1 Tax=Clostridium rhizosphaerae TaxID=2803861 RepID=A0ABS1T9Z2_9CLOT|nr:class I SAM-dependent methyltransferase [Clostridium rhizosphaerae]MBL4936155.1 methyltransferase domain-containing protein [Clostridium rhizosphaerae]